MRSGTRLLLDICSALQNGHIPHGDRSNWRFARTRRGSVHRVAHFSTIWRSGWTTLLLALRRTSSRMMVLFRANSCSVTTASDGICIGALPKRMERTRINEPEGTFAMLSLHNKIDFALIFQVKNANPNGDPLNGNRPRTDYSGFGEITDVCIKRKIRDRLLEAGHNILVQADDRKIDNEPSIRSRAESDETGLGKG